MFSGLRYFIAAAQEVSDNDLDVVCEGNVPGE